VKGGWRVISWRHRGTDQMSPNYRGSHQIPSCGGPQGRNPHVVSPRRPRRASHHIEWQWYV